MLCVTIPRYAHALTLSQGVFENKKPICSFVALPITFLAQPEGFIPEAGSVIAAGCGGDARTPWLWPR